MTLEEFFREVPRAAAAFSGGADSAFLLLAAKKCGCDIKAYYVSTAFQPEFERRDAKRLAGELGIPMKTVDLDILAVAGAAENGPRRCYYCKRALFAALREAAEADGYPVLLDGTNASDDAGDRPGMQASRSSACARPCGSAGSRRRSSGNGPATQGCLRGTSRPTPALPPGSPREPDHGRESGPGGAGGGSPRAAGIPGLPGTAGRGRRPDPGPGGTVPSRRREAGGDPEGAGGTGDPVPDAALGSGAKKGELRMDNKQEILKLLRDVADGGVSRRRRCCR